MTARTISLGFAVVLVLAVAVVPAVTLGGPAASPHAAGSEVSEVGEPTVDPVDTRKKTAANRTTDQQTDREFQDEQPETPEEFLEAFQGLAGTEAFQEYTEFETIREVGISAVQVGEFGEQQRREATAIYELLVSFDQAYQHAQADEDEASLDAADRSMEQAEELQSMDASYAVLAELALERFFGTQANQLFEEAEDTERTTERLERLRLASRAIQQTDQTDVYSQITTEIEELSVELERDRDQINASIDGAEAFVEGCADCTTPRGAFEEKGLGVFGAYTATLEYSSDLDEAADLAAGHGLTDRQERIQTADAAVAERQRALGIAAVSVFGVFLGVLAVVAMVITARVVSWHDDALESQVGNDVFAEEIRDA